MTLSPVSLAAALLGAAALGAVLCELWHLMYEVVQLRRKEQERKKQEEWELVRKSIRRKAGAESPRSASKEDGANRTRSPPRT